MKKELPHIIFEEEKLLRIKFNELQRSEISQFNRYNIIKKLIEYMMTFRIKINQIFSILMKLEDFRNKIILIEFKIF